MTLDEHKLISSSQEEEFREQAKRLPLSTTLLQVISTRAIELIDDQVHIDKSYPYGPKDNWTQLPVRDVAELVYKNFRTHTPSGATLAESFFNVHFAFNITNPAIEQRTMATYRNVVTDYVALHGELTNADHTSLTKIFKMKLPDNKALTRDYFKHRGPNLIESDKWFESVRLLP